MTFDLHIHGDTPAELLDALAHLGGTTNIVNASPAPQTQNGPVPQPDKPKAQTPAKQKKATQKPAAAPAEERVSPTSAPAQSAGAAVTTDAPAAGLPEKASGAQTTPAGVTALASDPVPVTENEIRTLVMELMGQDKRAECQKIIKSTGAKGISSLPPESYTTVWGELRKLKDEVNADASN